MVKLQKTQENKAKGRNTATKRNTPTNTSDSNTPNKTSDDSNKYIHLNDLSYGIIILSLIITFAYSNWLV
ncbi:hypothetical protein KM1_253460 [Entamoeba histolytica HM-3:IMSS]|uniref:Uncharacterized protein n=1 Tax=Entamoeba histolytica HM-3:IMSS TaxID=885315 RepID=M7VZB5_ENTHI|nr:hypothetical protein KM1_253460 [Entamoeba histolytica HM-3:IMSS]